ncbi:MAG: Glycosyltransferase [uncultured Sulfurovum sp.]|uniref:Glycosyltransferase n=1 Tax=uncultured Sulfurovum sp. TaxID=269237 RepID=A0A6S6U8X4_9BACT|nr:MAG: Glycosyltransferase [uncultured Sulfurovum sp.]
MINSNFKVKRLIKRNHFAKAIAIDNNKENQILSLDTQAWAYYNLGMYKTVANFSSEGLESNGLFAKTVSLAACGEFEDSKKVLEIFMEGVGYKKDYVKLADALAPFMPKLAFSILLNISSSTTLYTSLLLNLGEFEKAHDFLSKAVSNKEYREKPELLLYLSNSLKDLEAKKQLTLVNKYLLHFKVPKIVLKERTQSLSTLNIECEISKKTTGPLITIIMTTYKTGDRADVAIESILKQSYQNIELIVVDDASDDETPLVVKEWMRRDNRVRLIQLKRNVGTYVAKNIALVQAKGKYITCHDSDDWSHPLKIERQVRPLIRSWYLVATISSWVRLSDDGTYYARPVHPLMRQNPSSLMFKKDIVLKKAGIWDCVRTGADSEYIARLKLVFGRKKIKRIKEPLSFGAHRNDSLMTASDTGYSSKGMSPTRLDYWEAWGNWHIKELRAGRKPFISTDLLSKRKFDAAPSIMVDSISIETVLNNVSKQLDDE